MKPLVYHVLVLCIAAICAGLGCSQGEGDKTEKIDLKEVYSSFGQDGVKTPEENKSFQELAYSSKRSHGASNIYLVRGKDIDEAIAATRRFVGNRMYLDDPEKGQAWVVVYLGHGGSGKWKLSSVTRSDKAIRVHYRAQPTALTDWRGYYAWIPLGDPKVGKYQLELWDQDSGEKILSRSCSIVAKRDD